MTSQEYDRLLPTPVWHIGTIAGQGTFLGSVRQHGPDLHVSGASVGGIGVDDVPAVGRPGRKVTATAVVGELNPAFGGDLHHVDVLTTGCSGTIFAVPCKGEELAVGRPGRRRCVTTVGHTLYRRAVSVHDVELRQAGASADPGDLRGGARIEDGGDIRADEAGDAVGIATHGIGRPYLRVAAAGGGEGNILAVGTPGWGEVGAAGRREVHQAVKHQREHADLEALSSKRGEGEARVVGRDSRRERDRAEVGDGMLVRAVVIHRPDLFAASALHIVDLGFGDALAAAAQAKDDLVGEAMGNLAGGVVACVFAVLLGEHLRILQVLGVEEIAV